MEGHERKRSLPLICRRKRNPSEDHRYRTSERFGDRYRYERFRRIHAGTYGVCHERRKFIGYRRSAKLRRKDRRGQQSVFFGKRYRKGFLGGRCFHRASLQGRNGKREPDRKRKSVRASGLSRISFGKRSRGCLCKNSVGAVRGSGKRNDRAVHGIIPRPHRNRRGCDRILQRGGGRILG